MKYEMNTTTSGGDREMPLHLEAWKHLDQFMPKLIEAVDILLHHCDYDGHGWEEIQYAWEAAKRFDLAGYSAASKDTERLTTALREIQYGHFNSRAADIAEKALGD